VGGEIVKDYGIFTDNDKTKKFLQHLTGFHFNFTLFTNYTDGEFSTEDSSIKWDIKQHYDISSGGMVKVTM
jgi:hypothetical protein